MPSACPAWGRMDGAGLACVCPDGGGGRRGVGRLGLQRPRPAAMTAGGRLGGVGAAGLAGSVAALPASGLGFGTGTVRLATRGTERRARRTPDMGGGGGIGPGGPWTELSRAAEIAARPPGRREADDPARCGRRSRACRPPRRGRSRRWCRRSHVAAGCRAARNRLADDVVDLVRRHQRGRLVAVAIAIARRRGRRCRRRRRVMRPAAIRAPRCRDRRNPKPCSARASARRPRPASTSPAANTHPVNNFIAECSCDAPERFRSSARKQISTGILAVLGPDRGAIPGAGWQPAASNDLPCSRGLSRACVIDKNLAWSEVGQYHCLNFGAFPA